MELDARHELRFIPIDLIDVPNPRSRDPKAFSDIVANIQAIKLKKPITVTPRQGNDGTERYLLACGEGRLKAFEILAEKLIPALVVHVTDEEALIMSLAENIARRNCPPLERLEGIKQLQNRGYDRHIIAEKTGLSPDYVCDLLNLINNGEERLLSAMVQGRIPLRAALDIARAGADEKALQHALQEAVEAGTLRVSQVNQARRIAEIRIKRGRTLGYKTGHSGQPISSTALVREYQKETMRQQELVRKATQAQNYLVLITEALRRLLADENFMQLLQEEKLHTLPSFFAEQVRGKEVPHG